MNPPVDHGRVRVQVAAIWVQRVVDLGKTSLREDRINHAPHGRPIRDARRIPREWHSP